MKAPEKKMKSKPRSKPQITKPAKKKKKKKKVLANKFAGLSIIPDEIVINKIYYLRNEKIMIDRDLAEIYGVKAIRLREQVKRNIYKFPENFMFQLTKQEVEIMVSQNAIPSKQHLGGGAPYAFTEHGVLMLANILKSKLATAVSIKIIELFVKLRSIAINNAEVKLEIERIKKKLENHDKNIEVVFTYLDDLMDQKAKPRKKIGFTFPSDKTKKQKAN